MKSPPPEQRLKAVAPAVAQEKKPDLDLEALKPLIGLAVAALDRILCGVAARFTPAAPALALSKEESEAATAALTKYVDELAAAGDLPAPATPAGRLAVALGLIYVPKFVIAGAIHFSPPPPPPPPPMEQKTNENQFVTIEERKQSA